MFFSTAYRYLKGGSELQSLLPSKESADIARAKTRKLRLFCKGLECFREILYKVPVAEEAESAVQQYDATPSPTHTGTEKSISAEPVASGDSVQDQEHPNAETSDLGIEADQKPRRYVLESGENLFQSLYGTDKTPPTSPGGASSSSTLVDPSSRKVSPSDSTMAAKSSSIAAKDFAYSSLDVKHVRDPLSIAEENTKLELLRQLKKKTVGEEKASRKAEKQKAKNLALSAELDAAKEKLQSKEVEADVTKVHANAMILSNIVLRNAMQDGKNALRDEQHGVEVETTKIAGETVEKQEREGDLQKIFRPAGTLVASAYSHETILPESPGEFGEGLAHADAPAGYSPGSIRQEQIPPIREFAEMEHCGSTTVQDVDRRASEEPEPGSIGFNISVGVSASLPEAKAEGFLGVSKGKVDDLSKAIGSDELAFSGTMTSVESKAFNEVKTQGWEDATDEIGTASNLDEQESSSSINRDSWTEFETKHSHDSDTQVEDLSRRHNQTDEQSFRKEHSITQNSPDLNKASMPPPSDSTMPRSTPGSQDIVPTLRKMSIEDNTKDDEGCISITQDEDLPPPVEDQANDKPVDLEPQQGKKRDDGPTGDVRDKGKGRENFEDEFTDEGVEDVDDSEGTCVGREGGSHDPFEFSEPAGPATLWGILQTSQGGDEAAKEVNAVEEVAPGFDAAGPATLWGILRSNQSENPAKDTTVADDNTAEGNQESTLAPTNSPIRGPVNRGGREPSPEPEKPSMRWYHSDSYTGCAAEREWEEEEMDEDAASEIDSDGEETEWSPIAEASRVASKSVPGAVGAKSHASDSVALARPSKSAIPGETKCPRKLEGESSEAPRVLRMQGTKQDDVQDEKYDQTTYYGSSGIYTAKGGVMASGAANVSSSPNSSDFESSSPLSFSPPRSKKFDFIPAKKAQAPPELSKTQKRKLERKRAAAKKAEEAKRLRSVEEAAAQSAK